MSISQPRQVLMSGERVYCAFALHLQDTSEASFSQNTDDVSAPGGKAQYVSHSSLLLDRRARKDRKEISMLPKEKHTGINTSPAIPARYDPDYPRQSTAHRATGRAH